MLELILNGLEPKALIFERHGSSLKPEDLRQATTWGGKVVHIAGDKVSDGVLDFNSPASGPNPDPVTDVKSLALELSEYDRATLDGVNGDAARIAMRIILRMAHMMKATELMDVGLVRSGISCLWKENEGFRREISISYNDQLVERSSETLAVPGNRFLVWHGRAPKAGVYLSKNRLASVWTKVRVQAAEEADDSFWPILGYSAGGVAKKLIPVITGLEYLEPSSDDLKAFSAAFATSSSAPMFHIMRLTPEAPTLEAVCPDSISPKATVDLSWTELNTCWDEFNHGSSPQQVGFVSLGEPRFSCREIERLARL